MGSGVGTGEVNPAVIGKGLTLFRMILNWRCGLGSQAALFVSRGAHDPTAVWHLKTCRICYEHGHGDNRAVC
jgi:hypothetical protein